MPVSKVYETPVDTYGDVRTLVRGLPYQCPDDWEYILDSLDENSELYLVKEPDNPKDKLAIAAYLKERRIGYVAASDNGKIWLYLTDKKMPCKFIERFDASFKIAFENPRHLFEYMSYKSIYRDNWEYANRDLPEFDIPFITDAKDERFEWYDDRIVIDSYEGAIPDFHRKIASRMIVIVGWKDSNDKYYYRLPYTNFIVANVEDTTIKGLIDKYGFVIALPDVPIMISRDEILTDLHVTTLKDTEFKSFSMSHQSELVFNLIPDYFSYYKKTEIIKSGVEDNNDKKPFSINDLFPFFGITLGRTSWKQAEDMGCPITIYPSGSRYIRCDDFSFGDYEEKGIITSLSLRKQSEFPSKWYRKGFSWDNSYDEWVSVLKTLGFKINITHQPSLKFAEDVIGEVFDEGYLYAEFEALSPDESLLLKMIFEHGNEGNQTSSPSTLFRMVVDYKGISPQVEQPKNEHNKKEFQEESYKIKDDPEGGKHVSMGVIVPNEDDEDFDFCSYECRIGDKEQIELIKSYMKRYEQGKEPRPFIMIGRPLIGPTDLDIFYSLDGEIIFNFIFDEKIKSWIREAGFVLGKVKSYQPSSLWPNELDITLSVSKRKSGETLFKQASEEAMDYIEEYTNSQADHDVETRIVEAVKNYMSGDSAMPYKVLVIHEYGIGTCTTLDGEDIAIINNDEIIKLAEKNKGVFGYITKVDYDDDEDAWFTIRVSRSIPRLTMEQDSETLENAENLQKSSVTDEQNSISTPHSISEEVFSKFISDNIGCDVLKAPNSSWKFETTEIHSYDGKEYESHIFKKPIFGNPICKEIQAAVVKGESVNFCMDIKMNKIETIDFVYRYKKLFFPNYTLAKCKKEYGNEENLIHTKGISPALNILLSDMGDAYFMGIQTSFCNKAYLDEWTRGFR